MGSSALRPPHNGRPSLADGASIGNQLRLRENQPNVAEEEHNVNPKEGVKKIEEKKNESKAKKDEADLRVPRPPSNPDKPAKAAAAEAKGQSEIAEALKLPPVPPGVKDEFNASTAIAGQPALQTSLRCLYAHKAWPECNTDAGIVPVLVTGERCLEGEPSVTPKERRREDFFCSHASFNVLSVACLVSHLLCLRLSAWSRC